MDVSCPKRSDRALGDAQHPQDDPAEQSQTQIQSDNATDLQDQQQQQDDELDVISGDVSPHDSDFDFLQGKDGLLASPPLSCGSSAACSPSRFFKSPLVSRRSTPKRNRAVRTPQRRQVVPMRLGTPKRLMEAIGSLQELEEKTPAVKEGTAGKKQTKRALTVDTYQSVAPRTPSPSRLKGGFDSTEAEEDVRKSEVRVEKRGDSSMPLDDDDMQCVPSGLLPSPSEHDSFFCFANSLSPLVAGDEFESGLMSVRLSPLVSLSSCDLPRLLPPSPADDKSKNNQATNSAVRTPTSKRPMRSGLSSACSLTGGGISAPGSASPPFFNEAFPNIQASTTATPGQTERSKLGGHSVMKMTLHAPFEPSSTQLGSHSARELQAINNSLKRKKYIRRRKLDEASSLKASSTASNVQRRLLQTPVKTSASPHTRSPLHPWNGQTPPRNMLKTPTPRKLTSTPLHVKLSAEADTSSSPPVARRLLTPADTPTAISTPASDRKRKAAYCLSTPSPLVPLAARKSPFAIRHPAMGCTTPAKRIKAEAVGAPFVGAGIAPSVESSASLMMSLQSVSKAPLGAGAMALPVQKVKKAPCNCKKSKCLKLYCECFASGGYCDESCNCLDCANTTAKEEVRQQAIAARLEKNPNAFKPKIGAAAALMPVIPNGTRRLSLGRAGGSANGVRSFLSSPGMQHGRGQLMNAGLVATKMHKHGCHCKKSACQKKYCECYQAGVPCGDNCRCIDCKNQAPCVSHGLSGTPSRIATEIDETFVSPVLQGVRQRLRRIDRETWTKNFSSPFETSPGRERERSERFRSRLLGAPSSSLSAHVKTVPTASPQTPPVAGRVGKKRSRHLSPVMGQEEEKRVIGESGSYLEKAGLLKQHPVRTKAMQNVGQASLTAQAGSSVGAERVFVLPLFGEKLPPVESGVSAKIFRFLSNADLHNASLVSHLWNQVALGDTVWDHANFIPTEANAARSQKKRRLAAPIKLEPGVMIISNSTSRKLDVSVKREPKLSVLSALR